MTKADEIKAVASILSTLKMLKSNPHILQSLQKTPATAAELLDFQIDTLELFLAIGVTFEVYEKEIAEMKQRLQALELAQPKINVQVANPDLRANDGFGQ